MSLTTTNHDAKRGFKTGGMPSRSMLEKMGRSSNLTVYGSARLSTDFGRGHKLICSGGASVFTGRAYAPDGKETTGLTSDANKPYVKFNFETAVFTEENGPPPYPWGQNEVWRRKAGVAGDIYIR